MGSKEGSLMAEYFFFYFPFCLPNDGVISQGQGQPDMGQRGRITRHWSRSMRTDTGVQHIDEMSNYIATIYRIILHLLIY